MSATDSYISHALEHLEVVRRRCLAILPSDSDQSWRAVTIRHVFAESSLVAAAAEQALRGNLLPIPEVTIRLLESIEATVEKDDVETARYLKEMVAASAALADYLSHMHFRNVHRLCGA